jgi:uncharacterized protein (TIGR01777 family)
MSSSYGRSILITGGTGFIGSALVRRRLAQGDRVTVLTRRPARQRVPRGSALRYVATLNELTDDEAYDTIVNLAGASVVGPRWSAQRKAVLMHSRVATTNDLGAWLARTHAHQPPSTWVQASAIGFYGVRPANEILTETSAPGRGFMSHLCQAWESAAWDAAPSQTRQLFLRLGLVFGQGGALPMMLAPYRFGLGARLGDGRQVMSWIHLEDVLRLVDRAIEEPTMQGAYNAVAPDVVEQADFAATAGEVLRRPVFLRVPAAPLRWLTGEMGQLFLDGQRVVVPARLEAEGYVFAYPTLASALTQVIESAARPSISCS